jgi:hypothetical protein
MHCDHLHELIDDYLSGNLRDTELAAFDAHVQSCAECRDVVTVLRTSQGQPVADDLVVRPVLAATTGRSCARVQDVLAGDPEARSEEQGWAGEHVHGCATCAAVLRVLQELPGILPTFAEVDPGPDFTAEVLLVTLPRPSLWSVFTTRVRDHFERWKQRPEFAQEFAFALTITLVLLTVLPGSPLRELPHQALSVIQMADPASASAQDGTAQIAGTVGGQLRQGMRARGERLGSGFDRLGTHVLGTGRGLVDGDLEMVGENASQIGCDFQRLWKGVQAPAVDPETICG